MAFGGSSDDDILRPKMLDQKSKNIEQNLTPTDNLEQSEVDPTFEDFIINSDSLSSSASSISDSDITSTDSDDSLASESITDVTPLNSPYCDSPLPPSRLLEEKKYPIVDSAPPEMNVLMKAIEKLEVEARKSEQPSHWSQRRRTVSCGVDESAKIEQENQRLFKRVISQQNRMRGMFPSIGQTSRKNLSINRHQEAGKMDGDASGILKNAQSLRSSKDSSKYAQRQQKCLSHPSYSLSHIPLTSKIPASSEKNDEAPDQISNEYTLPSTATSKSSDTYPEKRITED